MGSIAVAIVNHNTREHLRACLASVMREAPAEVIVVDNASHDGSADMVRADFPHARLCQNATNFGYGAAANQAVNLSNAEYVLLLNSDTLLQSGTLSAIQAYLDKHPRAGVVGPRLVSPNGALQPSAYPPPTPLYFLLEESGLWRLIGRVPLLRNTYLRTGRHDTARAVPWVLGAALAIRRAAFLTVGGFDESYFLYFEEVDLALRLRAAGWETHFAPVATIVHVGGASTRQYRGMATRRMFASAALFYAHHYSGRHLSQLRLLIGAVMLGRIVRDACRLARRQGPSTRARLREDLEIWRAVLGDVRSGWATMSLAPVPPAPGGRGLPP